MTGRLTHLFDGLARRTRQEHRRAKLATIDKASFADVFEAAYFINLDRRPDRCDRLLLRFAAAGIDAHRVSAVDGSTDEIQVAFQRYSAANPVGPGTDLRPPADLSLYQSGDHAARIAALKHHWSRPLLHSAGSLAYLMTWERILRDAVATGKRSIIVFDGDTALHRNFQGAFERAAAALPVDWSVLQLGTFRPRRYPRRRWWSYRLFMNNGYAIGSHAVGLAGPVLPELLDLVERRDCAFDDGALSTLCWRHQDRAFVTIPELAIQDMTDSDIANDRSADMQRYTRRFRWRLSDYDL